MNKVFASGKSFKYFMWGIAFIAIFSITYNFPIVGDDWFAVRVNITSLKELIENGASHWNNVNGRYLGHIGVIIAMQSKVLCAILRAVIIWLIMIFASRNLRVKSKTVILIVCLYILAVPREIFSESYSWAAGFFNYVPPVALILISLYIMRGEFAEKPGKYRAGKAVCAFLLGMCSQLFAENITIYVLMMAVVVNVYYFKIFKKFSPVILLHAVGAITGTCLMFASPVYRTVVDGTDTYRTTPQGVLGFLQAARGNWYEISEYTIRGNALLLLTVTAVCFALLYKSSIEREKRKYLILRTVNSSILTGTTIYFFASEFLDWNEKIQLYTAFFVLDVLMCLLFIISVITTIIYFVQDKNKKARSFFYLLSAFVLVGPLLVVTPIGPRCFYASYIFTAISVLNLLVYFIEKEQWKLQKVFIPICVLTTGITVYYWYIFSNMAEVEAERDAYIVEQMQKGDTVIAVPEFPYSDYLHEPHSQKIGLKYYYDEARDIQFDFVPYSQWRDMISGNAVEKE